MSILVSAIWKEKKIGKMMGEDLGGDEIPEHVIITNVDSLSFLSLKKKEKHQRITRFSCLELESQAT